MESGKGMILNVPKDQDNQVNQANQSMLDGQSERVQGKQVTASAASGQTALSGLIANLNVQQHEIVLAPPQDMMVIAGAGTGKTHVVISRIAYLIGQQQVNPWEILAVTFTNKAAQEMSARVCSYLGWDDPHNMEISTFHSFCYRMLRRYAAAAMLPKDFTLLTPSLQESLLQHFLKEQGIATSKRGKGSSEAISIRDVLAHIDHQKDDMIKPDMDETKLDYYLHHLKDETELLNSTQKRRYLYEVLYACYEHLRTSAGAVDFADLINYMVVLLSTNREIREHLQRRYRYIFVDEFQDTNSMQYELLKQLKGPDNYVCVVGDDDQSIYEWRGAKISNVKRLLADFSHINIYALTINYRSTRYILNFANALISCNKSRLINKFLVNPVTYEGLSNCQKVALEQLFLRAQANPAKLEQMQADESLRLYVNRDIATLGEQERDHIFQYASEQRMIDASLVKHWEVLRWGDIDERLALLQEDVSDDSTRAYNQTLLRQAFPDAWIQRYQVANQGTPLVQLIEHPAVGDASEGLCVYSLIQHVHQNEGVPFNQIAVLYRKNSLSAEVEQVLAEHKIPYQIYGGLKFYERAEILTVLAYLRLLVNPRDDLSFYRVVNLPKRGIGNTTLAKLSTYASSCGVSLYEAVAQLAAACDAATQRTFKKVIGFYQEMEECRALLKKLSLGDFVEQLVQRMGLINFYQELEQNSYTSHIGQSRVDNVMQFIENAKKFRYFQDSMEERAPEQRAVNPTNNADFFADIAATENSASSSASSSASTSTSSLASSSTSASMSVSTEEQLRAFIAQSSLAAGVEMNQSGNSQGMGVQLMTIHSAKGLEFTTVIVMGCEKDILPSYLSDNIEEERRLAYVAFTRAKRHLFVCYAPSRYTSTYHELCGTGPSVFLDEIKKAFAQHKVTNKANGLPYESRRFWQHG